MGVLPRKEGGVPIGHHSCGRDRRVCPSPREPRAPFAHPNAGHRLQSAELNCVLFRGSPRTYALLVTSDWRPPRPGLSPIHAGPPADARTPTPAREGVRTRGSGAGRQAHQSSSPPLPGQGRPSWLQHTQAPPLTSRTHHGAWCWVPACHGPTGRSPPSPWPDDQRVGSAWPSTASLRGLPCLRRGGGGGGKPPNCLLLEPTPPPFSPLG